jgi:small-conductance mechanosensitive channel
LDWIESYILQNTIVLHRIFYTLAVLAGLYIMKRYTMRIIRRKGYDPAKQFTTQKVVKFIFIILFTISLLIIWQGSADKILSFIGFFTAGLAIAMRDILLNMIGYLYILWGSPFKVGDRIEISGQIGDVIDVRLLQFSILEVGNRINGEQSTGRIIHIPNMHVFSFPLANYEKGFKFIWNELTIPMDRNSDWELAKELIYKLLEEQTKEIIEEAQAQIEEAGKDYLIYYTNLTPTIYTEVKDNKIILTVRYLCEPRKARITEHILWEELLKMLKQHKGIQLG